MLQECLCSLGLVSECPAHPLKEKRKRKEKPTAFAIRAGECAACVALGQRAHERNQHPLRAYEAAEALRVGPVYCHIESLGDADLIIRDARRKDGIPQIQVLEGWFVAGQVTNIWMAVGGFK